MHQRVLVSGESNEAHLSCFFCLEHCLNGAAVFKDPIGVFHADDFVKLHQVHVVGFEPFERFVDLLCGLVFRAAVNFGH